MMAKQTKTMVIVEDESDSSTDFELEPEDKVEAKPSSPSSFSSIQQQRAVASNISKSQLKKLNDWKKVFLHLLQFSEDILPTVFYEPMKWCNISIYESLKHVVKTEELLREAGDTELRVLERNLEAWKEHCQSPISKSRLSLSVHLYKHAGDVFYFAFHQNRAILPEVRAHLDPAFEALFSSKRLTQTRALCKLYAEQLSHIDDFLSRLPQVYQSEAIAGAICTYLNPQVKEEEGDVLKRVNDLLTSPDHQENQVVLMMLAREDCQFKSIILDCMVKHVITTDTESAGSKASTSFNTSPNRNSLPVSLEDRTRYRLKLFLEASPDLLTRACFSTDHLPISLFDIIARGLDVISRKVTQNRSMIFEDFRPPLFDGNDPALTLPAPFYQFFQKLKNHPLSSRTLLERVKSTFGKEGQSTDLNVEFWVELFRLLDN